MRSGYTFLIVITACLIASVGSAVGAPYVDCVVRGNAGADVPLYVSFVDKWKQRGSIKTGAVVYVEGYPYGYGHGGMLADRAEAHQLDGQAFKSLGYVDIDNLDCDGQGSTSEYPIVIKDYEELRKAFGLFVDDELHKGRVVHERNRCSYAGAGDIRMSVSDAFLSPYKASGMPFDNLCMVLKTDGIFRYNTETGERLPTYVNIKDLFKMELPLIVPPCFARGKISWHRDGNGSKVAELHPIGCELKYNPWSGRLLDGRVSKVLAELFSVTNGGGELGGDSTDAQQLEKESPARVLTLSRIQALQDKMQKK